MGEHHFYLCATTEQNTCDPSNLVDYEVKFNYTSFYLKSLKLSFFVRILCPLQQYLTLQMVGKNCLLDLFDILNYLSPTCMYKSTYFF